MNNYEMKWFEFRFNWPVSIMLVGLFFNSQILSWSANNPIGIKGFSEFTYVFFIIFSISYVYNFIRIKGGLPKFDFFCFLVPVFLVILSSLLAAIKYDQPFVNGCIEARRYLGFYFIFVLLYYYRSGWFDQDVFLKALIYIGFLALILGVGVQLGIVPEINALDTSQLNLRQERASVGAQSVSVAIFSVVALLFTGKMGQLHSGLYLMLLLLGLLLVVQSRGILIASLASIFGLYVFIYFRGKLLLYSIVAVFLTILIIYFIRGNLLVQGVLESFSQLISGNYLAESVRAHSIQTVVDNFDIFGNGALWLQWNDGFSSFYGENFFLADIGIAGTFFQYGILAIPYVLFILYLLLRVLFLRNRLNPILVMAQLIAIYILIMWPIAAPMEYRPFLMALYCFCSYIVFSEKRGLYAT
jgi:hypothetical protein